MKVFEATVISAKMDKTAIVEITRRVAHPLYKKLIKRSKRYKVDTQGLPVIVGSIVKMMQVRPISKDKYFKLIPTVTKTKKEVQK